MPPRPILLVEDNPINRDLAMRRLALHGLNMIAAENGQEGVDMAREHQPGLVLMDISLPIKDGWEATIEIKNDPTTRHIPVLAVTAHVLPEDVARAKELGFEGLLPKPIDFENLISEIERLRLPED